MPAVVDIEQAVLLLEVEPPFDKRDIQLARRRLAKQWHPDLAPPGKQLEHERHLKAINEVADRLSRPRAACRGRAGSPGSPRGRASGRSRATRSRSRGRPRASAARRRARAPTRRSSDGAP